MLPFFRLVGIFIGFTGNSLEKRQVPEVPQLRKVSTIRKRGIALLVFKTFWKFKAFGFKWLRIYYLNTIIMGEKNI
jgi:hypothetical protein